jgi:hypothetical protein
MLPPVADRAKLLTIVGQVSSAIEELLLGGLTTSSEATRQALGVAMQEAARLRWLRLGSSLRVASEELARFTNHDASFSPRRLSFFLNRSWLVARGLHQALTAADEKLYDRLIWIPPTQPAARLDVVCLGAAKKVSVNAFVAFEFRLREVNEGRPLVWSCVFPIKPGLDIPAEGFLHLPQKQKFNAAIFLEGKVLTVANAAVTADESGVGRIQLGETSTVTAGKSFANWAKYLAWNPDSIRQRLKVHNAGPLDLGTELQEEIVLEDYAIGTSREGDEPGQLVFPLRTKSLELQAVVSAGADGKSLKKRLDDLRKLKKQRPPLYGLMHFDRCRLILQPLAHFEGQRPHYLSISDEIVNKAALLKAMKLT